MLKLIITSISKSFDITKIIKKVIIQGRNNPVQY